MTCASCPLPVTALNPRTGLPQTRCDACRAKYAARTRAWWVRMKRERALARLTRARLHALALGGIAQRRVDAVAEAAWRKP